MRLWCACTPVVLSVLLLVDVALPSAAAAHTFAPALLDLREQRPGVFAVYWQPPSVSVEAPAEVSGLAPELPAHCVQLPTAADSLGQSTEARRWTVDCGARGLRGEAIGVSGASAVPLDVVVRIKWRDGASLSGALHRGAPQLTVPPAPFSSTDAGAEVLAGAYVRLGIEHIWRGTDHLLFVLALLLLIPRWSMLLKTLTAFTLAHSLTLALAVLQVVSVPAPPVEALIAVSIVLVARELAHPPDAAPSLARQRPWLVAFCFGLLHGLGFAGALTALGLPPAHVPLALLAFNVGVEIGQLLFALAMLGPLLLWRRLVRDSLVARLVPAYAIGTLAVVWVLERIAAFWT